MADITKHTAKRLAKHLAPGESVVVAVLVEAKGAPGAGAIATALLPRTSTRRLERRAGEQHDEAGGIAAAFPGRSSVVAVTDRRARGLGHRLQLVIGDGSAVDVDAGRMQPFDRLAEELGTPPVR